MPVVPYSPGPRIPIQPLNVPRFTPSAPSEAFGGGIASQRGTLGDLQPAIQGAEAIGAEQRRMAYQEKNRADQIAITDRAGQLATYRTDALYKNNNGGWLGRMGQNAFEVPEQASTEFWQVSNVIRNSLTNDDQKAAFDKIAQGEWDQMHQQIEVHVAKQRDVYDKDATQGALDAKRDQAIKAFDDPTIVEPAIHARAAIIEAHGERNGLPPEFTKEQVAKATSDLRFEVLQQFVDTGRDTAAVSYLKAHSTDLIGKQLTEAEKLVNHASVEGEAQRFGDLITKSSTGLMDGLGQAALIQDPQTRDKTEQRVRRYYEDQATAQRQDRQRAFDHASQMVEQTGSYEKVPLTVRLKLSTSENASLQRRADQIQHPKKTTDLSTYNSLLNMSELNSDTKRHFGDLDLTKYQNNLSDADFKALVRKQAQINAEIGKADPNDPRNVAVDAAKARRDAASAATKAAKQAQDAANAQKLLQGMGINIPPSVPGAPLKPTQHAPSPEVNPKGTTVPQAWLDSAAQNPAYRKYLGGMGVHIPAVTPQPQPQAQSAPKKKPSVSIQRDSAGRATRLVPQD